MAKRLTLTETIKGYIRAAVGDDIDTSKVAVYESVAASTRPINQSSTAYHGAKMTFGFLGEMAEHLKTESVPILTMHNGGMLPIGKVIHADVLATGDDHDLNVMFYVEADSEYAGKIDLGIIDEVSVGAVPEHAFCSECGFDYMAPGNEMSFWFRECDKGHQIGQNGVHLRLTKLRSWKELSLVNKGASSKPKILGEAQQRLAKQLPQKLAASGVDLTHTVLFCSSSQPTQEDPTMDLTALMAQVQTLASDKTRLELQHGQVSEQLTAAQAQVASLTAELAAANTKLNELNAGDAAAKLATAEAQLSKLTEFVKEQSTHAAVAAGLELAEDATVEARLDLLKTAQVKLAAIPRGGVAKGAEDDSDEQLLAVSQRVAVSSAFTTNR